MEYIDTSSGEYLDQMIEFFRYVQCRHEFASQNPGCSNPASAIASMLQSIKRSNKADWGFSVVPNYEFRLQGLPFCGAPGETKVCIGGHLRVKDNKLCEQSIAVAIIFTPKDDIDEGSTHQCPEMRSANPEVVRRFHFDIDSTQLNKDRPISHLQYGGKFSSEYLGGSDDVGYRLFKSIKLPRLPAPPYDLVMVMDMVLAQFDTALSGHRGDATWRDLVAESERLLLRPYYEDIMGHFDAPSHPTVYHRQCCVDR